MHRQYATIGFLTGDKPREFQVLATLNNGADFIQPEDWQPLVDSIRLSLQGLVGNRIAVTVETRQSTSDFITLEE